MSEITPSKSVFEKILNGLDKPDAVARAAVGQLLGGDVPTTKEILTGKDYSARDLIDQVGNVTGLDLYAGDKGDRDPRTVDTILNTIADLGVYIGISPTAGALGAIGKGAKALAGFNGVGKATRVQKAIGAAAVGAAAGALTGDSPIESLQNAAIGATALGAGSPAISKGAGYLGKLGDKATDIVSRGMNPDAYDGTKLGITEATGILRKNELKRQSISRDIRKLDDVLGLSKLEGKEAKELQDYMKSSFSEQNRYRNTLEADILHSRSNHAKFDVPDGFESYQLPRNEGQKLGHRVLVDPKTGNKIAIDETGKAVSGNISLKNALRADDLNSLESLNYGMRTRKGKLLGGEIDKATLNDMTTKSNTYMGKLVNEHLAKVGNPALSNRVAKFAERNRKIMKDYNTSMRSRYSKSGLEYTDTVPMDFHIMEVVPDAIKKSSPHYDNLRTGFVRRNSADAINDGGLKLDELLKAESEAFPAHYMTKQEKEAKRLVNNIKYLKSGDPTTESIKGFLDNYDAFTGMIKQQHLTFSHSWVINNYLDNLTKAYLSGGFSNLKDTFLAQNSALLRNSSDNMVKDLLKLTDPNGGFKSSINFKDELMPVALKHGAISEGFFAESFAKGQISKEALIAKVGSDRAAELMHEAANVGTGKAAYNKYSEFLANTVGRTGQLVEGAARGSLFKNSVKNIMRDDAVLKEMGIGLDSKALSKLVKETGYEGATKVLPDVSKIYDEAARITNETFFDYGAISPFEQSVMKRIFPYWTFFSRNIPYWVEAAGQNAARVTKSLAPYKALGRKPTDAEREGIPDYLLEKGVRIGRDGNPIALPSSSLFDALSVVDWRNSTLEKLHPVLKTIKQFVQKEDDFGGELFPSDTKQGRKRVYGASLKLAPIGGTYRDNNNKKLYTDSDMFAAASTLQKNLVPVPLVDTIAKAIEGTKSKGTSYLEALYNLGPVKKYKLSPMERSVARKFRRANYNRKQNNKRKREDKY